jgi:TonB dependent receptor.
VDGISEADYQVIGNAYPDFILSLQNTFTYKNLDLSFLLRGSVGNDVLNQTRVYYEGPAYLGTKNILKSSLDSDYTGGAYYSSRFIEDGSYLKLDNITLGYNLSLNSSYLPNIRLYLTGQNLFTITKYKGIDPEINLSGLEPGIDWYDFYPRTKTFVVGVKLTF